MTSTITATLLGLAFVWAAPATAQTAEEQPVDGQPAEEAAVEVPPEVPAEPVGYDATVQLVNGSVLRGRVVDEDLATLTILLAGMAAEPIQVDKASVRNVILGSADAPVAPAPVEPTQVAVAVEPAQAPPTPAETGRSVGFGLNFGLGVGFGDTTNLLPGDDPDPDKHFDIELPGFELRLFPDDRFSLDFLFKIGNSAWNARSSGYSWYYSSMNETEVMLLSLYFHFHLPPTAVNEDTNAAMAIAPGLVLGGARMYGTPWWGQVGASMRIGVDLTSSDGAFGFGIYARPGISVLGFPGYSEVSKAAEILAEFTWTWYLPRAPGT